MNLPASRKQPKASSAQYNKVFQSQVDVPQQQGKSTTNPTFNTNHNDQHRHKLGIGCSIHKKSKYILHCLNWNQSKHHSPYFRHPYFTYPKKTQKLTLFCSLLNSPLHLTEIHILSDLLSKLLFTSQKRVSLSTCTFNHSLDFDVKQTRHVIPPNLSASNFKPNDTPKFPLPVIH